MPEMKTLTLNNVTYDINDAEAIKYTEQNLTEEQKAQARANIGIDDTAAPDAVGSSYTDYKINPDLNLLVLGDSIFGSYDGKDWVKTLGCNIQNYAVGGASLAEISEKKRPDGTFNTVADQFTRFKNGLAPLKFDDEEGWKEQNSSEWTYSFDNPDAVLICGGGNDYLSNSALGDITKQPNIYPYVYLDDDELKDAGYEYQRDTVVGALHALFRDIITEYPKAQRFFLIMHRVYQCNDSTLTDGSRRLWSVRNTTAIRVPYTRDVNGKSVTSWEMLYNQDNQLVTTNQGIITATSLKVRTFGDVDTNGNGYVNYSGVTYDKANLFKNGTVTTNVSDLDPTKIDYQYTYNKLRETIIKICNMYGFKIIDIYNDSPLNVIPPQEQELIVKLDNKRREMWHYWDWDYNGGEGGYRSIGLSASKTLSSNPILLANTEYFDWKGIHPTVLGYQIGYEPYVKSALCTSTKK